MAHKPLAFGQYYHIYNRGNNRENIFIEQRNYPYFLKLYTKHILPIAKTFTYCLMPNHFHLLIRTRTQREQYSYWLQENEATSKIESVSQDRPIFKPIAPSRAFNNMFIAYARAVNKATGRTGALFQRPFGRKLVTSNSYFQTLIIYIHHNPQKHGFVDDFRDWRWSSHGAFQIQKPSNLERDSVVEWFDGQSGFNEAHRFSADEKHITYLIKDDDF